MSNDMQSYLGRDAEGRDTLTFYAATFDTTPDLVGDIIDPGAFDSWLGSFKRSKSTLPICYAHSWDITGIVGFAGPDDVTVDTRGLLVSAHMNDSPNARLVVDRVRDKSLRQASFSYDVQRETKRGGANVLQQLSVIEAGPCLVGANPNAGLPKRLSRDAVRQARRSLSKALDTVAQAPRCPECGAFSHPLNLPGGLGRHYQCNNPSCEMLVIAVPEAIPDGKATDSWALRMAHKITKALEIEEMSTVLAKSTYAWTDAGGNDHLPLDTPGQVGAAINAASNNWTFRGQRMSPAPPASERAAIIQRILRRAEELGIQTDLKSYMRELREMEAALEKSAYQEQLRKWNDLLVREMELEAAKMQQQAAREQIDEIANRLTDTIRR